MLEAMLCRFPLVAWAPLAVGTLCTGLVFLVGCVRRRYGPAALPPPGKLECLQFEDPFAHGGSTERRGRVRRRGSAVPVLLSNVEDGVEPEQGIVFDRAAGGLAVAVEESIPAGRVLDVQVVAHPEMPWVRVIVRNV